MSVNSLDFASVTAGAATQEPLQVFLDRIKNVLRQIYQHQSDSSILSQQRGLPAEVWKKIIDTNPLSVSIPIENGGRGSLPHETLALLETASYESLALSLTFGINMGLFLQPVNKYANPEVKSEIFKRFLQDQNMGGLMITEPGYGSDALNMQTWYTEEDDFYHLSGKKHWAGLTGLADFWLLTARRRTEGGELMRDIDFFISDNSQAEQKITVEEFYDNLGLYQIPYGRNHIDVKIPKAQKLQPHTTGIKMMLDLLHRSRMQFPGMGTGFVKRMLDEGLEHCKQRQVGGKSLFSYDQVQDRLSKLQATYTICSAMSFNSAKKAGLENDLTEIGIEANSVKTLITDLMQQAAQSLTQLVGAKAYRLSHIAGRSITDSRPFQIFEGSNDILYAQIAESMLKQMKRLKETNLLRFLSSNPLTERSADRLKEYFNFSINFQMPQRKLVELGQVLSRCISMDMVYKLGDEGFRKDMIEGGIAMLQQEIHQIMSSYSRNAHTNVIDAYDENSSWLTLVKC